MSIGQLLEGSGAQPSTLALPQRTASASRLRGTLPPLPS